jgi:hypothetical protein
MWLKPLPAVLDNKEQENQMDKTSKRGKLLALVAPGIIAIEAAPVPWAVQGSTETFVPRLARTVPGCAPVRIGRLVASEPPAANYFHFSTKARSIT